MGFVEEVDKGATFGGDAKRADIVKRAKGWAKGWRVRINWGSRASVQ